MAAKIECWLREMIHKVQTTSIVLRACYWPDWIIHFSFAILEGSVNWIVGSISWSWRSGLSNFVHVHAGHLTQPHSCIAAQQPDCAMQRPNLDVCIPNLQNRRYYTFTKSRLASEGKLNAQSTWPLKSSRRRHIPAHWLQSQYHHHSRIRLLQTQTCRLRPQI